MTHSEKREALHTICDEECEKVFDALFDAIRERVAAEVPGVKVIKSRGKFVAGYAHVAWQGPKALSGMRVDPQTQQVMISLPLALFEMKVPVSKPVSA